MVNSLFIDFLLVIDLNLLPVYYWYYLLLFIL